MTRTSKLVMLLASFCFPLFASGATTQPPGLVDGDRYRLIFVTSVTRDGLSHEIADYNDFVTSVAASSRLLGPLGLEWTAIASTRSVDARDNTSTNPEIHELVPIYLLDGTSLFLAGAGPENMYVGPDDALTRPIDITENGGIVDGPQLDGFSGRPVFTGTDGTGVASFAGATSPLGGTGGILAGDTVFGGVDGLEHSVLPKSALAHFYAISEIITVPEPATFGVGLVWIIVLPSLLRKRRT